MTQQIDDFLSTTELKRELGVKTFRTIYEMMNRAENPLPFVYIGRNRRVRRSWLEAYIAEQRKLADQQRQTEASKK